MDNNAGARKQFSTRCVYDDLKEHSVEVKWSPLIWFTQCIPKHSFVLWMAIQEKLLTQDRIKRWGTYDMMVCSLCKCHEESHIHLFFQCNFSNKVWTHMLKMMGCNIDETQWNNIVTKIVDMPCTNSIWSVVRRLCLGATIYHLWQERNFRLFKNEERSWEAVLLMICETVKVRLMGLKVKRTNAVKNVAALWNVKWNDER